MLTKEHQSILDLQKNGKTISIFFHEMTEVLEYTIDFEYPVLSPVFSFIYQGYYIIVDGSENFLTHYLTNDAA